MACWASTFYSASDCWSLLQSHIFCVPPSIVASGSSSPPQASGRSSPAGDTLVQRTAAGLIGAELAGVQDVELSKLPVAQEAVQVELRPLSPDRWRQGHVLGVGPVRVGAALQERLGRIRGSSGDTVIF